MTDRYGHYTSLKIARPRPRILEVIMSRPGRLNALDENGHRELAEIWRDVDRDPDTSVAILRGEGGAFSAGGDLDNSKTREVKPAAGTKDVANNDNPPTKLETAKAPPTKTAAPTPAPKKKEPTEPDEEPL